MYKVLRGIFFTIILMGCVSRQVELLPDGVLIPVDGEAEVVRLLVLSDDIIRVSAIPEGKFSDRKSLMVVPQTRPAVPFRIEEMPDSVSVLTGKVRATVNRVTGEVAFADLSGQPILVEKKGGGKQFTSFEADGDCGYSVSQVFESPADEAFYGLGQHQSDEFNYKGRNETLYQYNTKVSVPFIVSNRNYGLLWDNNSLTRFGDPRDYAQLSVFDLYDAEGKAGALTAVYSPAAGKGDTVMRRETVIDYSDLVKVKQFPEGFNFNGAEICWKGSLEPKESGQYHFILYYAGYTKVYIDNRELVAERWRTAWNPNSYKFSVQLEKGHRYPLRIEWKPDGGVSYLSLKALSPRDPVEQARMSWWSELGDMIDYYFIRGENMDGVISGYRSLTGKSPVMPRWAMGYWQSRERYKTADELLTAVNEYRRRNIPLDNIVLDWSYWPEDAWGSHCFDSLRFPDPAGMVDSVHQLNARVMISVWPKFYHSTRHYQEFDQKGWMYRQAVNDSVRDWIGKGYIGSFYDAYSEGARHLFWSQMREHLYDKGFDAWWMDASEPDILSNASLDYRKKLSGPTALGSSTRYLNAYALMNAQAIYEGQRATDPEKRVFLLTRSGFGGLQRYSTATWSGDIGACWEDMKAQIPAGLNFSLSGIPWWTMDIGGFCVPRRFEKAGEGTPAREEWRELNVRWHQFGAFCPLYRSHGQYPYREMYHIAPEGHPAYESMLWYNRLRYRLLPYIYTLAGRTFLEDYTIMRALVMDFPRDSRVKDISGQYMFGPAFMVCPVYHYQARNREVWLPEGCGWYDFYTGTYYAGGQMLLAPAPYGRMPLFVREGSVIPFGPALQYTDEQPADPLILYVYTGQDADFNLYEDEGINYHYEQGMFSRIPIRYEEKTGLLTLGKREGSFPGMLTERNIVIYIIRPDLPMGYRLDGSEGKIAYHNGGINVHYTGKEKEVQLK